MLHLLSGAKMGQTSQTPMTVIDTEYLEEVQLTIQAALQQADAGSVEKTQETDERAVFTVTPASRHVADVIANSIRDDVELRKFGVRADDVELKPGGFITVTVLRPVFRDEA